MAIGMKDSEEPQKKVVDNLDEESKETITRSKNSMIIIGVTAIIIILIIVMVKSIFSNKDNNEINLVDGQSIISNSEEEYDTENTVTEAEEDDSNNKYVDIGLPDFDADENGTTSAIVYSASDYIKDLNGSDIPAVYTTASRTYIRDFVNYEAKRAIIDDGMEMYWLEVTYKGKKYRCQVPFYVFKDLDATGICVVNIELLTLEDGGQVISFMEVVTDYDDLINAD